MYAYVSVWLWFPAADIEHQRHSVMMQRKYLAMISSRIKYRSNLALCWYLVAVFLLCHNGYGIFTSKMVLVYAKRKHHYVPSDRICFIKLFKRIKWAFNLLPKNPMYPYAPLCGWFPNYDVTVESKYLTMLLSRVNYFSNTPMFSSKFPSVSDWMWSNHLARIWKVDNVIGLC